MFKKVMILGSVFMCGVVATIMAMNIIKNYNIINDDYTMTIEHREGLHVTDYETLPSGATRIYFEK